MPQHYQYSDLGDDETSDVENTPKEPNPQSIAEFILTALKLRVPILDRDQLSQNTENLGLGATMVVKEGQWQGKAVAIKTLSFMTPQSGSEIPRVQRKNGVFLGSLTREVRFLQYSKLRGHPNIMQLLGISWTQESHNEELEEMHILRPIAIVELAKWSLDQYIEEELGMLSLTIKGSLIGDIISGVAALHSLGLIHGDMKPQNVLIFLQERPIAKVADFGEAIQTLYPDSEKLGDSRQWKSPEIYPQFVRKAPPLPALPQSQRRNHPSSEITTTISVDYKIVDLHKARDVFSLGLTAMFVLMEHNPFETLEERGKKTKAWESWTDDIWFQWKQKASSNMGNWLQAFQKSEGTGTGKTFHRNQTACFGIGNWLHAFQERKGDKTGIDEPLLKIPEYMLSEQPTDRLDAAKLNLIFR
jgi:serine/threonine protein kinase